MTVERERRRSVRVTCTEPVEGVRQNPAILFRGKMRDLSETGCYVATRAPIEIESGLMMELRFKLGNIEHRVLTRVVQMIPATGIQMEFVQTGPRFVEIVRRFCETQLSSEVATAEQDRTMPS